MTVIALANLGTHDLKGENGEYIKPGTVAGLLDQPARWKEYALPILVPFLKAVETQTHKSPTLVLFITRQEEASKQFREKDTEPLGRLIKRWLEPGGRNEYQGLASKVVLAPPASREPHNHDLMLEWIEEVLPGCIRRAIGLPAINPADPPRLHISITAGTPAMNIALLFKAFGLGIGRVEKVWHVDERTQKAVTLDIGHVLAGEPLRRTFRAHLKRRDYEAAGELARYVAPKWVQQTVWALAGIRRSDFDRVLKQLPEKQAWGQALRPWVQLLCDGRRELDGAKGRKLRLTEGVRAVHAYQIAEMQLQFNRKDYPEALTALYRLQESLVRIAFEKVTGLPGAVSESDSQRAKWASRLKAFLHDRGFQAKFKLQPTRRVQGRVLQMVEPEHEVSRWLARLYNKNLGKRDLAALRNKSRVAHGFCAVTEIDIKNAGWSGGPREIVQKATAVTEAILGQLTMPPYEKIHQSILGALV